MSFGKLYSYRGNARTAGILAVVEENGLDIELVETHPETATVDYKKLNRLGLIPTFVGADGFVLTESIAIAVYFASQNAETSLLGKTKQDYASILRWTSFANSHLLPSIAEWFQPLRGKLPYNKKNVDSAIEKTREAAKVLDDHFLINTYLVGERLSLADLYVAGPANRGFIEVFGPSFRKEFPNFTRWFETIANQSTFSKANGSINLAEKDPENKPPASAQKPKEPKEPKPAAAPKPKAAAPPADDEDDEPKAEPKPKHPLEALGRPTFALDDWKRKYKNTDKTREEAMPWFWENVNFEEYSIWQVDFKYNEELTVVFMSNNQVGGFFNRLEASRKYLMGTGSVYGKANDSIIRGAFVVRGQEAAPAFDVAPDWESYTFTKLDHKSEADKATLADLWSWDKPVTVGGKEYEWADGKIFV